MKTPRPINHNIVLAFVQAHRPPDGSRRVQLAEFEEAVENGAIFPDVDCNKQTTQQNKNQTNKHTVVLKTERGQTWESARHTMDRGGRWHILPTAASGQRQRRAARMDTRKYKKREHTSLQVAKELRHVIWINDAEEIDVIVAVKSRHLIAGDGLRPEHFHLAVQAIVHDKVVSHANAVRLHRVPLAVVVVADLGIWERGKSRDGRKKENREVRAIDTFVAARRAVRDALRWGSARRDKL
jgi:hypothetical protein